MRNLRLAALLTGLALVLAAMVAMRPLLPIDETRYLSVAWEMHLSGDPVHLTRNFETYTHKPPLLFWLINLVWLVTGVSELAARLVGPVATVALAAATAGLARRFWPEVPGVGIPAAAALAGFPVFLIYGSATMFDTLLGLAVLAGISALWQIGSGERGRRAWIGFGLALALGVYAKGPVILVHLAPPLLTLPLWAAAAPGWRDTLKGAGLSLLVALGLVALWLLPALAFGSAEYRTELLWTQSAARVAGGLAHDRPVWFLAALLPVLLFPYGWSRRFWAAFGGAWRPGGAERLCLIWAASTLILFSLISGKQAHYLIPAFPALALLTARALVRDEAKAAPLKAAALPLATLGFAALAAGFGLLGGLPEDLAPLWPVAGFGALAVALALAAWRLPMLPGGLLAGAGVALGLHGVVMLTGLFPGYDGTALARRLAAAAPEGVAVVGLPYHAQFNFLGRLTGPVATPPTPEALADWATAHPEGLIVGSPQSVPAPPEETLRYMGREIGLWRARLIVRE